MLQVSSSLPPIFADGNQGGIIVRYTEPNVELVFTPALSNGFDPGSGMLYVAEDHMYWYNGQTSTCIKIPYTSVIVHAISREGDRILNKPSIYCQLDSLELMNEQGTVVVTSTDNVSAEMRLVPLDPKSLDAIFQGVCECSALHLDPESDHEEEGGWVYADDTNGSEVRAGALEHLESIFQVGIRPDGPEVVPFQFDDAEEPQVKKLRPTIQEKEDKEAPR